MKKILFSLILLASLGYAIGAAACLGSDCPSTSGSSSSTGSSSKNNSGSSNGGSFDFKAVDTTALSGGGKSSDQAAQQASKALGYTTGEEKNSPKPSANKGKKSSK